MFKKAKENKKGFTLAELLIVVAIIAVLVAISIPIFSSQLEKSRDAVSVANMRAAYAEAASAYLTANGQAVAKDGNVTVAAKASGKQEVTVENVVIKSQKADEWNKLDTELPFKAPADTGANTTISLKFTFTDGNATPDVAID